MSETGCGAQHMQKLQSIIKPVIGPVKNMHTVVIHQKRTPIKLPSDAYEPKKTKTYKY